MIFLAGNIKIHRSCSALFRRGRQSAIPRVGLAENHAIPGILGTNIDQKSKMHALNGLAKKSPLPDETFSDQWGNCERS
jgi:hypothetical protein